MTKKIIQTCDIVMEVTWLLALVSIPIYFNIYTSRVFEPDKITLFRSLVLVMLVAWAAKGLARVAGDRSAPVAAKPAAGVRRGKTAELSEVIYPEDGELIGPDSRPFLQRVFKRPLVGFVLVLAFVYLIATIFSIVPGISWWGSYQRLQGTYTFFSYVAFFLVLAFNIRERRQLERLISFVLLANIPVALYGIMQHLQADPLPWQGDVVFRVTSTMGNAIFISAYLIMVVPLALYRIVTTGNWLMKNRNLAGRHLQGRIRNTALSWIALYGCFMLFMLGLFFVVLNLNANYRPEASASPVISSTTAQLVSNNASGESVNLGGGESIGPWWALPVGIVLSFGLFFLFTVRRRGTDTNYLFRVVELASYIFLVVIMGLTILYSQSRGPEAGILVGGFVFFPLIFWRRRAWKWLIGWLGVGLVLGGILILFNLPAGSTPLEPVFKVARQNDQIARLGQFFETNDGTGRVRQLIWKTVLEVMGEAAEKEPARLLAGYGPESLYNKSPQHYQAELAQVEARNAIPDRSHNGYLDALVTTGVIGLLAYLAVVGAFFYYAFKFLRRTRRFEYQVLLAALISIMITHQIEIQTGIQIVSSWMMFFTTIGLVAVMGGLIYGRWDAIGQKTAPKVEAVVEEPAPLVAEPEPVLVAAATLPAKNGRKPSKEQVSTTVKGPEPVSSKIKGTTREPARNREQPVSATINNVRGPGGIKRNGPVYAAPGIELESAILYRRVKPWFYAAAAALVAVTLCYVWIGNVAPIMADTVYKQGFNLAQAQQWPRAVPYLKQSLGFAPNEDYYELYLGQAYLELATTEAKNAAKDKNALTNMQTYLAASERELLRANKLAPLNPDHYANLARLYTRWADLEPTRATEMLNKAVGRYLEVVDNYAPRNARLWAELAATQASIATNRNDTDITGGPVDKAAMDKAIDYGLKSVEVDTIYDFNRLVLGDVYRFAGRKDEAGQQYLKLAQIDPLQLANDERYTRRMLALSQSPQVSLEDAITAFDPVRFDVLDKAKDKQARLPQDKAYALMSQGAVYLYKNRLDDARNALNTSIGMNPNNPYVHAYLSVVFKKQGATAQAQSEATTARTQAASSANAQSIQQAVETLLAS